MHWDAALGHGWSNARQMIQWTNDVQSEAVETELDSEYPATRFDWQELRCLHRLQFAKMHHHQAKAEMRLTEAGWVWAETIEYEWFAQVMRMGASTSRLNCPIQIWMGLTTLHFEMKSHTQRESRVYSTTCDQYLANLQPDRQYCMVAKRLAPNLGLEIQREHTNPQSTSFQDATVRNNSKKTLDWNLQTWNKYKKKKMIFQHDF